MIVLISPFYLHPGLPNGLLPLRLPIKTPYTYFTPTFHTNVDN